MLELNDFLLSSSWPQNTGSSRVFTKTGKSAAASVSRSLLTPAAKRASYCAQVDLYIPCSQALSRARVFLTGRLLAHTCSLDQGGGIAEWHHSLPRNRQEELKGKRLPCCSFHATKR